MELVFDAVRRAVRSCSCDCIALSGGIDTSVVALAAVLEGLRLKGFTAYYVGGLPKDLPYALHVAGTLGIDLNLVPIDDEYIRSRAPRVVECTGHRDYVELRNDVVFFSVLEKAMEAGCRCLLLGDGGDELFAGYSFTSMLPSSELKEAILHMGVRGRYPGLELAECIGVSACAPFLVDEVAEAVLGMPVDCLRWVHNEGKAILRLILLRHGLQAVALRAKTPAEAGSGTNILTLERLTDLTRLDLTAKYI